MDKEIIPAYDMKIPQFIIKSSLENIGLKMYSYWILNNGFISTPADTKVHVAYIVEGFGYYNDLKIKAGDTVAFGLNINPIHFHSHKLSLFVIDMDFSLFYSLTGLEPCICLESLLLHEANPFYQLGQTLFHHPVISWIPIIETYILKNYENPGVSINKSIMERVIYAEKEIAKARDFHSIAKDMAISYRQLQRDFRSLLGLSLKEYRDILRFYAAARNLKKDTIAEVAHNVGYYDQSHMNREFKKKSDWTPSQVLLQDYY